MDDTLLSPICEDTEIKKDSSGKPTRIKAYMCPTCGNQITFYNSRYSCRFCHQHLSWNIGKGEKKHGTTKPETE